MSACTKGFALAMATLVVNSIGLALSFDRSPFECGGMCADPEPPLSLFMRFFAMGFIPCSLAGIFIGALVSTIPTLAAVTAFERWTRAPRELPLARARYPRVPAGVHAPDLPVENQLSIAAWSRQLQATAHAQLCRRMDSDLLCWHKR